MFTAITIFLALCIVTTILYVGAIAVRGAYRDIRDTGNGPMNLTQWIGAIIWIAILISLLFSLLYLKEFS